MEPEFTVDPHLPYVRWRFHEGHLEWCDAVLWWRKGEVRNDYWQETPERIALWISLQLNAS